MSKQFSNYKTACYLKERKFDHDYGQTWKHHRNSPHGGNRHDMFGFIDVLLFRPDFGILAVQACVATALAEHRRDVGKNPKALGWLQSGGKLYLFSWRKVRVKGGDVWQPRIERAALRDGRIRFYVSKGADLELPGAASQRQTRPSEQVVKVGQPPKTPPIAGDVVKIQSPQVLKRRRALMQKRQVKRALLQNNNQEISSP